MNFFKNIYDKIDFIFSPQFIFSQTPSLKVQKTLVIICISFILLSFLLKVLAPKILKNHKIRIEFSDKMFSILATIGFSGLVVLLFSWQEIKFLSINMWWYILALIFMIWAVIIIKYRISKYPKDIFEYEEVKRKEKYLPRGKKK